MQVVRMSGLSIVPGNGASMMQVQIQTQFIRPAGKGPVYSRLMRATSKARPLRRALHNYHHPHPTAKHPVKHLGKYLATIRANLATIIRAKFRATTRDKHLQIIRAKFPGKKPSNIQGQTRAKCPETTRDRHPAHKRPPQTDTLQLSTRPIRQTHCLRMGQSRAQGWGRKRKEAACRMDVTLMERTILDTDAPLPTSLPCLARPAFPACLVCWVLRLKIFLRNSSRKSWNLSRYLFHFEFS